MLGFFIMLGIAVILSACFVVFWNAQKPIASFWLKGIASIFVLLLAFFTVNITAGISTAEMFLLIGLGLCVLGDVTLALIELALPEKKENIINMGTISFLMAHIGFVLCLTLLNGIITLCGLGLGLLFALGVYLLRKPMNLNFGKALLPSLLYAFTLASSLGCSIVLMITTGFSIFSISMVVAFAFFVISDLILSKIYFGGKATSLNYILNLSTYYIAILLIASSFALI